MLRPGLREKLKDLRSSFVGLRDYAISEACYGRELRRYCKGKSGLLLNIGCGQLTVDGWVNIDYKPVQRQCFYLDVRNGLPLSNDSARHIHCEHFLEHLEFSEARRFLCECARVLDHAGTMRLIVPDLERYVIAYAKNDHSFFEGFRHLAALSIRSRRKVRFAIRCSEWADITSLAGVSKPYSMRLAAAVSRM